MTVRELKDKLNEVPEEMLDRELTATGRAPDGEHLLEFYIGNISIGDIVRRNFYKPISNISLLTEKEKEMMDKIKGLDNQNE